MINPILELKNVNVKILRTKILDDLSFSVNKADFIGIIGPNGAGKTTLLKAILGLQNYTGAINLFGDLWRRSNLKFLGYVPQHTPSLELNFPATVQEIVLIGRIPVSNYLRRTSKIDQDIINEILEIVNLTKLKNRKLNELSGGEFQRVLLAKALAVEPKILVLDEPSKGLDSKSETIFYDLLEKLNKKHGKTIILASHDLKAVKNMTNKVIYLNTNIKYSGKTNDFFAEGINVYEKFNLDGI